jgi:ceramide glucosyltransferase
MGFTVVLHLLLILLGLAAFGLSFFSLFNRSVLYRRFRDALAEKYDYEPPVSIIMPIRERDEKLRENLNALLDMNYPKNKYEIIFVVDDDEEIHEYLKKLQKGKNIKIVKSVPLLTCSGKNSAMIAGVKAAKYEIIASIDSDTKPSRMWLRSMVGPLENKDVGVTTGYRYYVPGKSFVSYILSAWNNIGLGLMQGSTKFVWGGSFAIKKSLLQKLGIVDMWSRTISEDTQVTRAMRKAKLDIAFVPQCITKSHISWKFSHPLEFTTRQVMFVKLYDTRTWRGGLASYLFGRITIILGIILLYLYFTGGSMLLLLEALLLLWPIVFGLLRASVDHRNLSILTEEKSSHAKYVIADFLSQWLMTYNTLRVWKKKTIEWRGRKYLIKSPYEIEVLS